MQYGVRIHLAYSRFNTILNSVEGKMEVIVRHLQFLKLVYYLNYKLVSAHFHGYKVTDLDITLHRNS